MDEQESALLDFSFASTTTYTFVEEIGRGGMGIVYLAERDSEGVRDNVVLKILRSRSEADTERLKREANIATGLRHENIIKTYGMEAVPFASLPQEFTGELDFLSYVKQRQRTQALRRRVQIHKRLRKQLQGRPHRENRFPISMESGADDKKLHIIVMDFVDGTDLSLLHYAHVKNKLLIPTELAAFIISRMCRALEYAHEFIVHRDISPGNVLINRQGVCKLTDFGVAVSHEDLAGEENKGIAGKLHYMAPEQIHCEEVDGRADIYAVGIMAYQILTGINYFLPPLDKSFKERGRHVIKLMDKPIPAPIEVRPDIPQELSDIVSMMLKRDPSERFQTAGHAGRILEQKYLYSSGFGPTNNSLASYIDIFESDYRNYDQEQLYQLVFLKDDDGKIDLKRKISKALYTPLGQKLSAERNT